MKSRNFSAVFASLVAATAPFTACTLGLQDRCAGDTPVYVTVSSAAYEAAAASDAGLGDAGSPLDAAGPAEGGWPGSAACMNLCPGERSRCFVSGLAPDAATLECVYDCTGRRPAGYCAPRRDAEGGVAGYFARMSALEAVSVTAFRDLARELDKFNAPRPLVQSCRRAARDEIRHTRATRAMARQHGGSVVRGVVRAVEARTIEQIAIENAVEGCIRETFGALIAHTQASRARDPGVRQMMQRIALEETEHARLSWRIDAWSRTRLDRNARRRVDAAQRDAARTLLQGSMRDVSDGVADRVGLPTNEEMRALAARFVRAMDAA